MVVVVVVGVLMAVDEDCNTKRDFPQLNPLSHRLEMGWLLILAVHIFVS